MMNLKEKAHEEYKHGNYKEAVHLYNQALPHATTTTHKIALHSNKAACYLKLKDFKLAYDECTAVLELDRQHVGALMLRSQTLVALNDYHSALFDVNRLIELNPSCEAYENLQARLRTQLSLTSIPEVDEEEVLMSDEENMESNALSVDSSEAKYSSQQTMTDGLISKDNSNLIPASLSSRSQEATMSTDCKDKVNSVVSSSSSSPLQSLTDGKDQINSVASSSSSSPLQSTMSTTTGWDGIPKPKGHSGLDYSRWDKVGSDSSDEDSDEDSEPQFLFRLRNVGIRPVK